MITVVTDANIIIDLLQIDIFRYFLKLNWGKYVPPDVTDEVQEPNSDQLIDAIKAGKIILPSFSSDDLLNIQELKTRYSALSFVDCSCLYLASHLSAILLTGERRLRNIATDAHHLTVHGTLYVLERLIEQNIITHRKAHEKLSQLMQINNRLPHRVCVRLLKRWEQNF